MSWLFSQALVAEYLAATSSGGEPSVRLSETHTPQAYCSPDKMTDVSRLSRFGMTFAPLTDDLGADVLTWYREDFLVRTSASQEKAQDLTESAPVSGLKCLGLLARFDRDSHSWKTLQLSLLRGGSESLQTLPRWGIAADGELWELAMSGPLIGENESGLWPTPTCDSARSRTTRYAQGGMPLTMAVNWPTPTVNGNYNRKGASATSGDGLATAVNLWPTPAARDWQPTNTLEHLAEGRHVGQLANQVKMTQAGMWATPMARDWKGGTTTKNHPEGFKNTLCDQVQRHWPTPQASDNRDRGNAGSPAIQQRQKKGKQIMLSQSVSDTSGALNPQWVEWLMGWPLGWTDLKPLEMDRFQSWQQQHSIS